MEENQKKKEQTALISIVGNIIITLIKFIAFYYTRSIVVLAEAWHSLTDILTSFMVYFALKKDFQKPDNGAKQGNFLENLLNATYEIKSSILIGGFIFMVGLSLLMRAFFQELEIISYPLESGLFFLFFSLLSYIIYRFESQAGKKLSSPGLISDGMHSRSDALTSLVAGLSLILYHFGLNIERLVASIISIIIIGFGIEVVYNSIQAIDKKENIYDLKINQIVFLIFTKEYWLNLEMKLKINVSGMIIKNKRILIFFLFTLIFLLYLSTSLFTIGISQKGIIERLGTPLEKEYGPGIHLKLPYPFDTVRVIDAKRIRKIEVGNISRPDSFALLWSEEHGTDQPFISGDNNLFYPFLSIHYDISNIKDYFYNSIHPEEILSDLSNSVITDLFAKRRFFDIATYQRKNITGIIIDKLQALSDELGLGIRIINIVINDVHPPIPIAGHFEDVIAAMQDREMLINRSVGFRNSNVPEARSEAIRTIEQAKAYAYDRIAISEGIRENFGKRLAGFQQYPHILRLFFIIDTLSNVYEDRRLFIIDHDLNMPDIWEADSFFAVPSEIEELEEVTSEGTITFTEEERRFLLR